MLCKPSVVQVRSLLNNEKALPKGGRVADRMMGEYEAIMLELKRTNSEFVIVKKPQQHSSSRTPGSGRITNFNKSPLFGFNRNPMSASCLYDLVGSLLHRCVLLAFTSSFCSVCLLGNSRVQPSDSHDTVFDRLGKG